MRSGEPRLLDHLIVDTVGAQAVLDAGLALPDGGHEDATSLVDGERLVGAGDVVAEVGVVELEFLLADQPQRPERNAEGADGVPDPDEVDPHLARPGVAEAAQELLALLRRPLRRRRAVVIPRVAELVHVALVEDADEPDEPAEAADGEGAAR